MLHGVLGGHHKTDCWCVCVCVSLTGAYPAQVSSVRKPPLGFHAAATEASSCDVVGGAIRSRTGGFAAVKRHHSHKLPVVGPSRYIVLAVHGSCTATCLSPSTTPPESSRRRGTTMHRGVAHVTSGCESWRGVQPTETVFAMASPSQTGFVAWRPRYTTTDGC